MNPWQGLNKLPKDLWLMCVASFINRAGTMVLPFLALYLTQGINISTSSAGLIITAYGLGALITAPFVGRLSDRIGALNQMKLSLIFSGLILFIYPLVTGFIPLLLMTICWAVVNEAFRPANLSLISEIVSADQRKPAFALYRLAINLGMSIGPIVGGFLSVINFSYLFYADGITSIGAGLFLVYSPWQKAENSTKPIGNVGDKKRSILQSPALKDKNLIFLIIAILPIVIVYFQHQAAMAVFVVKYLHFSESTYGVLFAINTVLIILVEVPLNNYLNHWTDKKSLAIGAMLIGIGFGGMAFAINIIGLVVTIIIWTFGEMILFPASASFISRIAPENSRGEYMGFYQINFSLAFTIGPWLGMMVLEHFGPETLWFGAFILALIASGLMVGLLKESELHL